MWCDWCLFCSFSLWCLKQRFQTCKLTSWRSHEVKHHLCTMWLTGAALQILCDVVFCGVFHNVKSDNQIWYGTKFLFGQLAWMWAHVTTSTIEVTALRLAEVLRRSQLLVFHSLAEKQITKSGCGMFLCHVLYLCRVSCGDDAVASQSVVVLSSAWTFFLTSVFKSCSDQVCVAGRLPLFWTGGPGAVASQLRLPPSCRGGASGCSMFAPQQDNAVSS